MVDTASYSNYSVVRILKTHIDWTVQFAEKTLCGWVRYEVEAVAPTDRIVLDARELSVTDVSMNDASVPFEYTKVSEALGDKLTVLLGKTLAAGEKGSLRVLYSTSRDARALQFLSAEQTTDRKGPFLFSQCQAIHARSMLPCMDTPSIKVAYTAKVTVPAPLTALMSAITTSSKKEGDLWEFSFEQVIPIPSYLIAIVVGVLEKREISGRCAVWAEPSVVDSARYEFDETEQFLVAAEDVCGEYVWKRYDMVVLPATFPYGGMENPCLTFVTPTIIAGDRSLVSVIAHEIAHSWTGNLVTNCNWDHFWMNEGFTVYVERRIIEKVYGSARRYFDAKQGWKELIHFVKANQIPEEHAKLRQKLGEMDPDDVFCRIPYEKGSALLLFLEQNVFTAEETRDFIKKHVERHAYKCVNTEEWLKEMKLIYPKINEVDDIVQKWIYESGVPPREPLYSDTSLLEQCDRIVDVIVKKENLSPGEFNKLSSPQKEYILHGLREKADIPHDTLDSLAQPEYGISTSGNCEVQSGWLLLGVESKWEPIIPAALVFAKKYGRLKYCKTVYTALFKWPSSRDAAAAQFKENCAFMHPIARELIQKELNRWAS